jgi:hypothetical protein
MTLRKDSFCSLVWLEVSRDVRPHTALGHTTPVLFPAGLAPTESAPTSVRRECVQCSALGLKMNRGQANNGVTRRQTYHSTQIITLAQKCDQSGHSNVDLVLARARPA